MDFPRIISCDDHVVEAPDLWESRLSGRFRGCGPRVVRGPGVKGMIIDGRHTFVEVDDLPPCDFWVFEDVRMPVTTSFVAAAYSGEENDRRGVTYDEMRPGFYDPKERVADMDLNHVEASLCFPNLIPRFAGQTFLEASDKDLALLCVQAYNDWVVDEWSGDSNGRLIPICITPLWDPELAAREVRRNAHRGVRAVTFTELPSNLGLPSIHDKSHYWDPFFRACDETSMVICMHVGSSGVPSSSRDAPGAVGGSAIFAYAMLSLADWLFSGVFERFPNIKITYSEAEIGWIPALLERADSKWEHTPMSFDRAVVKRRPSDYYRDHVFGCFISDKHGVDNLQAVGEDNVTFEVDYPHGDTTWPNSLASAQKQLGALTEIQQEKIVRGNAIKLFGLSL